MDGEGRSKMKNGGVYMKRRYGTGYSSFIQINVLLIQKNLSSFI